MKSTTLTTLTALLATTLPLTSAQPVSSSTSTSDSTPSPSTWTLIACNRILSDIGTSECIPISCAPGKRVSFSASPGRAIEANLYADGGCRDEITHFAGNTTGYVLPEGLGSVLVLN
ncbi:hypothetical protein BJY04DRAFT_204120 [Aspergillus karnatakaensis]|uniref:uncharacterized protein n=1 Tax=Aspergillus karnatakaensis TaxID=1810916 RepID=UPI003CCCC996